jgi:hypothetical protein
MKTASHSLYRAAGGIVISRGYPRFREAGIPTYRALFPKADMLRMEDEAAYRTRYFDEVLAPLDPQRTWDELHALAAPHEPVLLCFEDLRKPGLWCHRRLVAEWLERALGVEVAEAALPVRP